MRLFLKICFSLRAMSPRVPPLSRLLVPLPRHPRRRLHQAHGAAPGDRAGHGDRKAPAVDDNKPNPVQEAANARLAGVAHTDLVGPDGVKAFQLMGEVAKVELTPFTVAGQPFTDAVRVDIKEGSSHEYAVQMATKIAAPVKAGDAILATFYLRTETPQEGSVGETEFVFELAGSPYTKSVSYPVQGPERWTRVQVRFESVSDYAAGEAQMIFRLGYDPQVIELGGIRVESYGKLIASGDLPSSQGADRRRERAAAKAAKAAAAAANQTGVLEGGPLAFQIDPAQVVRPISPYVYGISSQPPEGLGVTVRRMGGNRQTAYNWEINASSAGSDYQQSSDEWACTAMGYTGCKPARRAVPAVRAGEPQARHRDDSDDPDCRLRRRRQERHRLRRGQGAEQALAAIAAQESRGARSLSLTPDLNDNNVYEDEFVNLLVKKLGPADKGGVRFYSLDNEPALWPTTHPRVHPAKTTYAEMAERTGATASEIVEARSVGGGAGRRDVRVVRIHVALRRARRQGEQREVRQLPRLLPGHHEEARGREEEAPGARARRPLVPGGARHQADHGQGFVGQDGLGAAAGGAQPLGFRPTSRRAGSPPSWASRSASSRGCSSGSPTATRGPSWG